MIIQLKPAVNLVIPSPLVIEYVRHSFKDLTISAKVTGIPKEVVLWNTTEYASNSAWNMSTALSALSAALSLSSIPWLHK